MLGEVDLFGSGFCGGDGFPELINHTVEEEEEKRREDGEAK